MCYFVQRKINRLNKKNVQFCYIMRLSYLYTMDSKEIYFENASTETQKMEVNRDGRQFDLSVAASGHGGGYCCDTCVDLPTLLALLAGKKTLMTNKTIHQLIIIFANGY